MDPKVHEDALEDGLDKLERARSWSPRVISRLEHHIRSAGDADLFRMNPLQWATDRGVDEFEAVDLFLHGAKVGLVDMDWNVICPCCGRIMHRFRELHDLQSQNSCTFCFRKDRSTLDDYVQVTFTVSPSVRPIRYLLPESLTLDEYCFTYLFEPSAIVAGILPTRDAMRLFRKHLSLFEPGERLTIETDAQVGVLSCTNLFGQQSFALLARGDADPETQRLTVTLTDHGFEVPLPELEPGEFNVGGLSYAGTFYPTRPGHVEIEFVQGSSTQAALAVFFFPIFGVPLGFGSPSVIALEGLDAASAPDVTFSSPRLTAKRLFATQTFHDLFRSEVFREAEGFGVKDLTILFTDLKGSTQLYQREGDLNAYALVREHYGILHHAVSNHHGAVVKTIGDAIMATFDRPVDAVAAGLDMLRDLPRMNQSSVHGDLVLKVGIHRGTAISVALNDRIDYFGQTVNMASRVQGIAGGGELLLTEDAFASDGVAELIHESECQVTSTETQLRGIEEPLMIYRVCTH